MQARRFQPVHQAARTAMELLCPTGLACLCCGSPSYGQLLCSACRQEADLLRLLCPGAQDGYVWKYDGCIRTLIHNLKDQCIEDCALVLAQGIAECVAQMRLPPDTLLTWVTMPEARRRQRGIDHGRILCESVAGLTGLPVRQIFTRVGDCNSQRELSAAERLRNLNRTFVSLRSDRPVLLIDDVETTGATAAACRNAALRAGTPWAGHVTAARVLSL